MGFRTLRELSVYQAEGPLNGSSQFGDADELLGLKNSKKLSDY